MFGLLYLLQQLWPYVALAFVIGFLISWFTCEHEKEDPR